MPKLLRALRVPLHLKWNRSNVSGTGFVHLTNKPHLNSLAISHTPLTHEGAAIIGKLHSLEFLRMAHTPTTDEDLAAIESLTRLRILWLDNTAITDSGLMHLERLTALEHLRLPAAISDDAFSRLKKDRPNCTITRAR